MPRATDLGDVVAGFIAAEGTFTFTPPKTFAFAVTLGALDAGMCELLQQFFGVGRIRRYRRRQPHFDDEVVFVVRRIRDLVDIVVPFADVHLAPCHKREQYLTWRAALLEHWDVRARRQRGCTAEGCDEVARARGLCRRHYYASYGR